MSSQSAINKSRLIKIGQFSLIILLIVLGIWFANQVSIEEIRSNVQKLGICSFGYVCLGNYQRHCTSKTKNVKQINCYQKIKIAIS